MTAICQKMKLTKVLEVKGVYVSQQEKGNPKYEEVIYNTLSGG